MRELYKRERERVVGTVAAHQLQACRDVLAEQMYSNRQLETVIRMLEIETGEQANQIEVLLDYVAQLEKRNGILIDDLNRARGGG